MSIASEVERIQNNISDAYNVCNNKGATMPSVQNSNNLASTISSITSVEPKELWLTPKKEIQLYSSDVYSPVTVLPIPDEYIIPTGDLEITKNGTFDVTNIATALVNVAKESIYIQDIFVGTKTSLTYSIDFEPTMLIIKCNENTQIIYDNLELSSKANTFGLLGGFVLDAGTVNGMEGNLPWFMWVRKTATSTTPEIIARNVGYFMTKKYNESTKKWDISLGYEAGSFSFRMALNGGNLQIVFAR